ncbi:hypothetical protein [Sphingopyxis sp. 2PD]|uniref:hypothetical protein n=1 Tax=Sphingopyxis sp. 2PD TaxID=2502196 RepID=UPI0010FA0D32|nr:hypothetical protein [Sphingopyxis sp. 2PD]
MSLTTPVVKESFKSDRENKHSIYISNADTTQLDPFEAPDRTLFPFETVIDNTLISWKKAESPDSRGFGGAGWRANRIVPDNARRQLSAIGKLNF